MEYTRRINHAWGDLKGGLLGLGYQFIDPVTAREKKEFLKSALHCERYRTSLKNRASILLHVKRLSHSLVSPLNISIAVVQ